MATINSKRPAAAVYNGMHVTFVRDVTDEMAYNPLVDQVVVKFDNSQWNDQFHDDPSRTFASGGVPYFRRPQNGEEMYFFANEVELTPDETKANEKSVAAAKTAAADRAKTVSEGRAGNTKLFATTKRKSGAIVGTAPDPAPNPNASQGQTSAQPPQQPQSQSQQPRLNPNPAPAQAPAFAPSPAMPDPSRS